jgi:hypothetical protein
MNNEQNSWLTSEIKKKFKKTADDYEEPFSTRHFMHRFRFADALRTGLRVYRIPQYLYEAPSSPFFSRRISTAYHLIGCQRRIFSAHLIRSAINNGCLLSRDCCCIN